MPLQTQEPILGHWYNHLWSQGYHFSWPPQHPLWVLFTWMMFTRAHTAVTCRLFIRGNQKSNIHAQMTAATSHRTFGINCYPRYCLNSTADIVRGKIPMTFNNFQSYTLESYYISSTLFWNLMQGGGHSGYNVSFCIRKVEVHTFDRARNTTATVVCMNSSFIQIYNSECVSPVLRRDPLSQACVWKLCSSAVLMVFASSILTGLDIYGQLIARRWHSF